MSKIFLSNIRIGEEREYLNQFKTITFEDGATDIYGKNLDSHKQIFIDSKEYEAYNILMLRRLRKMKDKGRY